MYIYDYLRPLLWPMVSVAAAAVAAALREVWLISLWRAAVAQLDDNILTGLTINIKTLKFKR